MILVSEELLLDELKKVMKNLQGVEGDKRLSNMLKVYTLTVEG